MAASVPGRVSEGTPASVHRGGPGMPTVAAVASEEELACCSVRYRYVDQDPGVRGGGCSYVQHLAGHVRVCKPPTAARIGRDPRSQIVAASADDPPRGRRYERYQ